MPVSLLRQRNRQPETMDGPGLDPNEHHRALQSMGLINWVSASSGILWPGIRDLFRERRRAGDRRPVRLLDVATGAGDVPLGLWRYAHKKGFALEVAGCDRSPLAVEHARAAAAAVGAPISFFRLDLLSESIPAGYDVLTCNLFLHHLDEVQAVTLLRMMRDAAGELALVNDLGRGPFAWLAAYVGARVLSGSPIVHADATVSVEGAFKPDEALALARQAGWEGATVRRKFPYRYLLTWRRP